MVSEKFSTTEQTVYRYVNTRIKTSTENLPTQPGSVLAIRTDILFNFVEFLRLLYKNRQIWADTAGGDFA